MACEIVSEATSHLRLKQVIVFRQPDLLIEASFL